jgi:uncharacterized protein (TIGR02594 family)
MCQVIIPATRVLSPTRPVYDDNSENSRYNDRLSQSYSPYSSVDAGNDVPFGFAGANGGPGNSGNFIAYNTSMGTPPKDTPYGSLDYILTTAIKQDWLERGSPPNPLIAQANLLCGTSITVDGPKANPWCAAFVSYALENAGIDNLRNRSSQSYLRYGNPVDWRIVENIRMNDIVVFTNKQDSSRGHVGFIRGINPTNGSLKVWGGNQSNTFKESPYPFNGKEMFVNQVRRNWPIPTEFDKPIAGQATGTATRTPSGPTDSTI